MFDMNQKGIVEFDCQNCGKCCEKLTHIEDGHTKSLTLTAEEAKHFPKDTIKPEFGYGTSPTDIRHIVSYQVSVEPCPHYDAQKRKCDIYQQRPIICQRFPLTYDLYPQKARLVQKTDCNFIEDTETRKGHPLDDYFTQETFKAPNCWDALEKEYNWHRKVTANPENLKIYHYDIKTNTWNPW